MKKASIRSIFIGLSFCVTIGAARAETRILHEAEPIHLAGCPLHDDPALVLTGLASSDQDAVVYRGGVMRASFSGSLIKQERAGSSPVTRWDAAALLEGRVTERRIFTSDGNGNLIAFKWNEVSSAQRALLERSSSSGVSDGLGEWRLRYLAGDRSQEQRREGGIFPRRDSMLGGIVHGIPLHVAAPASGVQLPGYQAFRELHRQRRSVIYIGTVSGMMHAFDEQSGEELFAYVPHAVFQQLPLLTALPRSGTIAIDGGMAVADVMTDAQWRTVLAFGIGRGAQGVVALDVSDPQRFGGENHLIWEFNEQDDADVGEVVGMPVIARFRTELRNGVMQYAYFVMIASGVNNRRAGGEGRSASGPNALFLLSLDKKKGAQWKAGINYFKFIAPSDDVQRTNGMTDVTAAMGVDHAVNLVYAGDLHGNLWRFDFSQPLATLGVGGNAPQRLFAARDASGNRQSISHKPAVVFAPGGGNLVLFGTGKYLSRSDLDRTAFTTQSFYSILDRDNATAVQRSELVERALLSKNGGAIWEVTGDAFVYGTSDHGRPGWVFDFPDSALTGERVVSAPTIVGTNVLVNSLLPAAKDCQVPTARMFMLNTLSGLAANARLAGLPDTIGAPGSFAIKAAIKRDNPSDANGKRRMRRSVEVVPADAPSVMIDIPASASSIAGRLSWRELVNWDELRSMAREARAP